MFFFHTFCTIGHWYVINGKPWQPWFMGGTGNFADGFKNMPFTPMDTEGYYFGLILLGHPIQLIVTHFFINEREPDFAEMAMHHLAHFSIASSYIFTNIIPIGAMIAFVHDQSDVAGCLAKFFHNMGYKLPAGISLITCEILWLVGRLICLPLLMMELNDIKFGPGREHMQIYFAFSQTFVGSLLLLHIYWFAMFMKMNYKLVTGSKVKDEQADFSKMVKSSSDEKD